MKYIIFMILTGLYVGQLVSVSYNNKIYKILDYNYDWKFWGYNIVIIDIYQNVEVCFNTDIKDLTSIDRNLEEYKRAYNNLR